MIQSNLYIILFVFLWSISNYWYFFPQIAPYIGLITFKLDSLKLTTETNVTLTQFSNNFKSSTLFRKYNISENSGIILVSTYTNYWNIDSKLFQHFFLRNSLFLEIRKENYSIELNLRLPILNVLLNIAGPIFIAYFYYINYNLPDLLIYFGLVMFFLMLIDLVFLGISYWYSDKLLAEISKRIINTNHKI